MNELKFLGVIFDEKLSFRAHLDYACIKARKCLFALRSCALRNFEIPSSYFATIFISAIIPKLLYGLPVWYSVFRHKGPLAEFTKVIRAAALMSARVPASTPNRLLFLLASCLPPDVLLEKQLLQKMLTICTNTFFSTADYNELVSPTTDFSYRIHQHLFQKHKLNPGIIRDLMSTQKTTNPIHPADRIHFTVSLDGTNYLTTCNTGDLIAYSDVSKTKEETGAASSVYQFPDLDTPIAEAILTLDHSAEVYQAEVVGLSTVPELCVKLYSSLPITPRKCHVFVDNKATLSGVKDPNKAKDPVIRKVHECFAKLPLSFQFSWCKGHSGIKGNDYVDTLAKKGANQQGLFHPTATSKNQACKFIATSLAIFEKQAWSPIKDSSLFFSLDDLQAIVKRTKPQKQQDDTTDCYLVRRLLSGKYPTQDNLFKWKLASNPTCSRCNSGVEDSLYHHIVNCSALARDRTDLCNIIGFLPNHLPDLLKDRKSILALHSFLHKAKVSSHHQECTGVSPERENKRQSAQDNLPPSTKKTKTNTSPKVHKRKYNLQSTDCPLMDQVITQRKKKDKK